MRPPLCIQMVGLPGSGKSTLRRELMREFGLTTEGTVIVSLDDYIHSVRGEKAYAEAFAEKIEEATIHVGDRLAFAHRMRLPTIIDMTNLTAGHRKRNVEALPTHRHIAAVPVVPHHVRVERLAARTEQTIPGHVLESMERKFRDPCPTGEPWLSEVRYYDSDHDFD